MNSRRWFLKECGLGVGKIAIASLLADVFVPNVHATDVRKPRAPHFPGKAKHVIPLFMAGAPSQPDLFDNKPKFAKLQGQPLPPLVIAGQPQTAATTKLYPYRKATWIARPAKRQFKRIVQQYPLVFQKWAG